MGLERLEFLSAFLLTIRPAEGYNIFQYNFTATKRR